MSLGSARLRRKTIPLASARQSHPAGAFQTTLAVELSLPGTFFVPHVRSSKRPSDRSTPSPRTDRRAICAFNKSEDPSRRSGTGLCRACYTHAGARRPVMSTRSGLPLPSCWLLGRLSVAPSTASVCPPADIHFKTTCRGPAALKIMMGNADRAAGPHAPPKRAPTNSAPIACALVQLDQLIWITSTAPRTHRAQSANQQGF
jgi:hypothetical protein